METYPITFPRTVAGADEALFYRSLGVTDDEMMFCGTNGKETVILGKAGLIKVIRRAPCGPVEGLRRFLQSTIAFAQGMETSLPVTGGGREILTLEDELEVIREG